MAGFTTNARFRQGGFRRHAFHQVFDGAFDVVSDRTQERGLVLAGLGAIGGKGPGSLLRHRFDISGADADVCRFELFAVGGVDSVECLSRVRDLAIARQRAAGKFCVHASFQG